MELRETISEALAHKAHIMSYKITRAYDDFKSRKNLTPEVVQRLEQLYNEALNAFSAWIPAKQISQIPGLEAWDDHSALLEEFKKAEPAEIDTFVLTKQLDVCSANAAWNDERAFEAKHKSPVIRGEYEHYKRQAESSSYSAHRCKNDLDEHLAKHSKP